MLGDAIQKLHDDWDKTLHIARPEYWKIQGVTDPESFFKNLPVIYPYGMTLLVEGLEMGLTAKSLFEEFPAKYRGNVSCDTLIPVPESFHVEFSEDFATRLCQVIKSQGLAAVFYHFKGYSETEVVFTFHDAFESELVVSKNVPEAKVMEFAKALGLTAERSNFPGDLRQQLIAVNRALNPPWWRRILNLFVRPEK